MNMENVLDNEIGVEDRLTEEVNALWGESVRISGQKKASATELRLLRARLAEKLFAMKGVLSRIGRGGQWRCWLAEVKIPRSTADRLVERHSEMVGGITQNVPDGAITEKQQVEALVKSMLPRLRKVLVSSQLAYQYVVGVIEEFDLPCEATEGGILLMQPSSYENPPSAPFLGEDRALGMVGQGVS